MKNKIYQIIGGIVGAMLVLPFVAMAINITVPAASGPGFLLQSTTTGQYQVVSLTAGSNITIATTSSNITISAASGSTFPFTVTGYGVSTSTIIGFTSGLLSTASTTVNSTFNLPTLSNGCLNVSSGLVGSTGSSCATGTVTSVTATYPIQSTGGTTPVISTAFGTTTANTFGPTQTFGNASTTNLTTSNELNIPHSGTVPTLSQGDIYQNTNSIASSSIQTSESPLFNVHSVSTVLASSTLVYMGNFGASGTTTLPVVNSLHTVTIQSFGCTTDQGTAWVAFGTGLATTTAVQCNSTGKFITVSSNNVFVGRKLIKMDVGTSASSPNTITVTTDVEDSN